MLPLPLATNMLYLLLEYQVVYIRPAFLGALKGSFSVLSRVFFTGQDIFSISRVGSGGLQFLTRRARSPDPTRPDPPGLTRPVNSPGNSYLVDAGGRSTGQTAVAY